MTTILTWRGKDYIFLAGDSQVTSGHLKLPFGINKIMPISENCLVATCGTVSTMQQLISRAKKNIKICKIEADNEDLNISVDEIAKELARLNFNLPLHYKKFEGAGFLVAGFQDDSPKAVSIDTDGALLEIPNYIAEGSGAELCLSLLSNYYNDELPKEQTASIVYQIIKKCSEGDVYTNQLPVVFCVSENKIFRWEFEENVKEQEIRPEEKKE